MKNSIDDCIFIPNPKQESKKEEKLYCVFGEHEFLDEENNPRVKKDTKKALAKLITSTETNPKYFIKIGQYGQIYNPIGLYSEGKSNKFLAKIGKNAWDFKEVNKNIFDLYVNFLRTKNLAWLNNAERGLK